MMFFCPWHLMDVVPPLIAILLSNFANSPSAPRFIIGAYCSLVSLMLVSPPKNETSANCLSTMSITSLRTAPYSLFCPVESQLHSCSLVFSSGILTRKKSRTVLQFLSILSPLSSIPNKSMSGNIADLLRCLLSGQGTTSSIGWCWINVIKSCVWSRRFTTRVFWKRQSSHWSSLSKPLLILLLFSSDVCLFSRLFFCFNQDADTVEQQENLNVPWQLSSYRSSSFLLDIALPAFADTLHP